MAGDTLSALEAGFLYLESARTPMHIGSVAVYDGGPWRDGRGRLRVRALRAHVEGRLAGLPRLRQRPVWPCGRLSRPMWVDDPAFDIARHVEVRVLPHPAGEAEVTAAAVDLHMELLDRRHPLWALTLLEGLPGGRVAIVERVHHALVDGIGSVDLAMLLLDTTPDRPKRSSRPSGPAPGTAAVSAPIPSRPPALQAPGAGWHAAAAGLHAASAGLHAAFGGPAFVGHGIVAGVAHPVRAMEAGRELISATASLASRPLAPHSSLNDPIGEGRLYRVVRRSLESTRQAAHGLGGTVNDVLLAAVAAGLQELLVERHEAVPDAIHALVPVSVRAGDEHRDLGNRIAALIVPLPMRETGPDDLFKATRAAAGHAKQAHQAELTGFLLQAAEQLPEPCIAAVSRLVHHQPLVNLVVTNVPGPPVPLYLMGAPMLEASPIVPLAANTTLSIGILSYLDELTIGIWADADRVPDLAVLARGVERGLDAMEALAGGAGDGS